MSKRSLFLGSMAVVITVLLIFAGCSQSNDPAAAPSGGPIGGETTVNIKSRVTADELANVLADNAVVTLVGDYDETIVVFDTKDGTIQPTTLHIPTDRTLVIGDNVTLIFDDDHLSIARTGTLRVAEGGALVLVNNSSASLISTGDLQGSLIVDAGGLFIDMSDGTLWGATGEQGTGTITYRAGAVVYGAGGEDAYYSDPANDAVTDFDLTTNEAKDQKRFGPKDDPDATIQLLTGDFIQKKTKYEMNGDAVLAKDYGITPGLTLQINEGKTAVIKEGVSFSLLVRSTGTTSGKLIGGGKLVAGNTEITGGAGGWQAVTATAPGNTVKLTISAAGSAASGIEASDGVVIFTGSAGATITQKQGLGNTLTIGAVVATTINLTGTAETAGAQIILEGDADGEDADQFADNPGKIVFNVTDSLVQIGTPTLSTAFGTAAKIGEKTFGKTGSPSIYTITDSNNPGTFLALKSAATSGIDGGLEGVTIDSTQEVTGP
ncbi:MAG: hypothetical protein LBG25_00250 [Spirochaetaceae bacterium]|jgi:hypothetical protein|nr:hypothetical protein [Spirochaetaceae bacterium]